MGGGLTRRLRCPRYLSYRQPTNHILQSGIQTSHCFAMEAVSQTFDGQVKGGSACNVSATISRNGDLVHRVYLEVDNSALLLLLLLSVG